MLSSTFPARIASQRRHGFASGPALRCSAGWVFSCFDMPTCNASGVPMRARAAAYRRTWAGQGRSRPTYFDPQEREREKQALWDADERALANGVSAAEIEAKNAFLTPARVVIHWDPNREF